MKSDYFSHLGLHEPWAVHPEYAYTYLPLLAALLRGETPQFDGIENSEKRSLSRSYFVSSFDDDDEEAPEQNSNLEEAPEGAIAVLSLNGMVMKYSQFCGPRGTLDLAAELKRIDSNPNFIGTVFKMESGGGQSYAQKPITDVMDKLKKPVVLLGGNIVASAALGIGVHAKEIVVDHPRSIIGSIGTFVPLQNIIPALEKLGVQFHDVYATKSTLKNNTHREALKGNYKPMRQNWIDPMNQDFIDDVAANRLNLSADERIFKGETFLATEAKELGLIDHLGDFEFAKSRVKDLSKNKTTIVKPESNMKIDNIKALAGIEVPTAEQMDLANAELTAAGITHVSLVSETILSEAASVSADRDALQTANSNLNTQLKDANTAKSEIEGKLATANTTIADLQSKVEAFGKNAGAINSQSRGKDLNADEDTSGDNIDDLPHNQYANEFLGI